MVAMNAMAVGLFFSRLLDLVYPRVCVSCGRAAGDGQGHICWDCLSGVDVISKPFCSLCGDPVDGLVEHEYLCSSCQTVRPHFALARSAVRYTGAARAGLLALKYEKMTCLARDFLPYLDSCVRMHYAKACLDGIAFVPLYPRKERERTFNQSKLLAANLARATGVPLLSHCLERVRYTRTQTDLNAGERRLNVRGAFVAVNPKWIEGRNLLLVDDVMTTGATVGEVSRVLKEAGAAGVFVVTVARG